MKVRPKVVDVEIHKDEALQIINALNVALKDEVFNTDNMKFLAAHRFKSLLEANFMNDITGIHSPVIT